MDLYLRRGIVDDTDTEVMELSDLLNRLASTAPNPTYRNPNGVSMKLANLASLDPRREGVGLRSGGRNDRAVWEEFIGDPSALVEVATAIRKHAFTTVPPRRERRYWAFNALPDLYRIEDAVASLVFDSWSTKGRPIQRGDRVIIWKASGRRHGRRGVVALGEVATDPELRRDGDNPFWI